MGYLIPTVLEKTKNGEIAYDLYSRLLKDRIVFIHGEVTMEAANLIVAELLFLEKESPKEDIYMYINSHGGSVMAGLAIHDTIKHISCDVSTIGVGMALSMGAFLLASGKKGKRLALPNCTVLLHQPLITLEGTLQTTDLEIQTKESNRLKNLLNEYLSEYIGRNRSEIEKDTDRDRWMSAKEAKEYGIIDKILKQNK